MSDDTTGKGVDIDGELWAEFVDAKAQADKYKDLADDLGARIKKEAEAADASLVKVDGEHRATVTPTTAMRFDSKRFKDDWPDIYSQYQVTQKSTRLTIRKEAGNGG